ncbi:sugar kinase [Primorskyibacter aestuariivivens]|uniref:sugar kinase n=1 Tax=Primorskyibacter aestuariivivens TaxID=1888912 RepID=UPI002301DBB6|nr:sugar kinase [Primorskyibacter aestuariivivens]MDA7429559.1 sugar kinase [Primorskyibacter aestuariivivens]
MTVSSLPKRFVSIGECMVELAQIGAETYRRGFAGDTFNTAWYARRLLPDEWQVGYLSAIGTDAVSGEMRAFMEASGVDTSALREIPDRTVGLYMISTDKGERSFSYWRSQAAARLLAEDERWLDDRLSNAGMVHFSGITLAILSPEHRQRLCNALNLARANGTIVSFDTNLRPRLWESPEAMKAGLLLGASAADIVLPSFDEETELFGDGLPDDTIRRYAEQGAKMVVVKNGEAPLTAYSEETGQFTLTPTPVENVTDTTAAGDSFAAGVLAQLAMGATPEQAAETAMALARRVIQSPGALVPDIFEEGFET